MTHLGYGEPQILEVFKNTLPTKLYGILFPIEDLRQAVETAKRIGQEKNHSQETIVVTELEVQATVGWGQDPEPVLIGIG